MWQALSRPELRKSAVSPFRLTATTAPALVVRSWLPALLAPRGRPSISSTRQPGGVTQVSWMRWISLIWRSRWVQYGGERSKFKSCHSGYRRREIVSHSRASSPKSGTRRGVMDRFGLQPSGQHTSAAAAGALHPPQDLADGPVFVEARQLRHRELALAKTVGIQENLPRGWSARPRTGENAGTMSGGRGVGGYHATSAAVSQCVG